MLSNQFSFATFFKYAKKLSNRVKIMNLMLVMLSNEVFD